MVGIPAELFTELGRDIKRRSPFEHTLCVTPANGYVGYVAARADYGEGGYETTSSIVVPGAGERIVDEAVALLKELHNT